MKLDKKMMYWIVGAVGIFIILILILWFYGSVVGGTKSFEQIEDILESAASKYMSDNPNLLPGPEEYYKNIDSTVLVSSGYMKELSSYVKDDVNCSAKVTVYYVDGNTYDVVPNLYCGSNYRTVYLKDLLMDTLVVDGAGLYERVGNQFVTRLDDLGYGVENATYIYRGDNPNNYVKLGYKLFRIVEINGNEDMLLIDDGFMGDYIVTPWDNRYNADIDRNWGINDYSVSRMRDTLKEKYDTLNFKEEQISKLRNFSVCIDGYKQDVNISSIGPCDNVVTDIIGLLPAKYFAFASLDENCKTLLDKSCGNYNYLSGADSNWWTVTADTTDTHSVYYISRNFIDTTYAMASYRMKPIMMLASTARFVSGTGTKTDPYIIR